MVQGFFWEWCCSSSNEFTRNNDFWLFGGCLNQTILDASVKLKLPYSNSSPSLNKCRARSAGNKVVSVSWHIAHPPLNKFRSPSALCNQLSVSLPFPMCREEEMKIFNSKPGTPKRGRQFSPRLPLALVTPPRHITPIDWCSSSLYRRRCHFSSQTSNLQTWLQLRALLELF